MDGDILAIDSNRFQALGMRLQISSEVRSLWVWEGLEVVIGPAAVLKHLK